MDQVSLDEPSEVFVQLLQDNNAVQKAMESSY